MRRHPSSRAPMPQPRGCGITSRFSATLYRGIASGRYPKPIKVSPNGSRWIKSECLQALRKLAAERLNRRCPMLRWPPDSRKARGANPGLDDGLAVKTGTPFSTPSAANHQGELRNARRVRQAHHLHAAGVRPVFEALLAVAAGQPIDEALAEFLSSSRRHIPRPRRGRVSAPRGCQRGRA
jgi:predicted DNA-binding transcriptional regulator AlpA